MKDNNNSLAVPNLTIPPEAYGDKALTQKQLKELLSYDPATGVFTWLQTVRNGSVHAGAIAGVCSNGDYVRIQIRGRLYLAHRLAWLYVTGSWPDGTIDHVDTCKSNNRFSNLRLATAASNGWNCPAPATNTSGVKGVHWHTSNKRWYAKFRVNGRDIHVGSYINLDDAKSAIKAARAVHHGSFANHTNPRDGA